MVDFSQPFLGFPRLETARLYLRQVQIDDAKAFYAIYSDPGVLRYYDTPPYASLEQARAAIRFFRRQHTERQMIRWSVVLRDGAVVIGTVGCHNINPKERRLEVGFDLHPDFWRQGFMTEALGAVLGYVFNTMHAKTVEARTMYENTASVALLQKFRFTEVGTVRQSSHWSSEAHTIRVFQLYAHVYQELVHQS